MANGQWQKQPVKTTSDLRGLSVVDEKVIWASGSGGTVLRTNDAGKTWKVVTVPGAEKLDFRDIEAFDENTAYILSIGNGENSRIYKTTNGGGTWNLQFANKNPMAFFDAIAFWNKDDGIAMSDPVDGFFYLIQTEDGGATWRPIPRDKNITAKPGESAFAASGTCLITVGKNDVYIVSGGSDSRVFHSDDRGQSWNAADTPFEKGTAGTGIFSIVMRDEKHGIIVGGNYEKPDRNASNLAFTRDRGETWEVGQGLSGYRSSVAYINKDTVIAVGSNGTDMSITGGKTWSRIDSDNYNTVQTKGTNIWAVGPKGVVSKLNVKKKIM